MATNVNGFLLSLAAALATAASLHLRSSNTDATPGQLFVHNAVESAAAAVYSVLRIYPGPEPASFAGIRMLTLAIQADTRGKDDDEAVLAQAVALHEALLDSNNRPRMHWSIAGKVLGTNDAIGSDGGGNWEVRVVRFRTAPGIVGKDEQGRSIATSNFEVDVQRA